MKRFRTMMGLLLSFSLFGGLMTMSIPTYAAEDTLTEETAKAEETAEAEEAEETVDAIEEIADTAIETDAEILEETEEEALEESSESAEGDDETSGEVTEEASVVPDADKIYDDYEYQGEYLWYEPQEALGGACMADVMASMGVSMMDFEAFTKSEIGEYAWNSFVPFMEYGDDITNEDNIAYWESVGMKYEFHDEDDPEHKWISMVPMSYYEDAGDAEEAVEESVEATEEAEAEVEAAEEPTEAAAEATEEAETEAEAAEVTEEETEEAETEAEALEETEEAAEEAEVETEAAEEPAEATEETEAETEAVEDKKYPVLFVWHGNDNPIMMAEHYGFGELAAEREWIVVCPWADNDDIYLEEFDRIMDVLRTEYPIDETRIYTTGFSKGGFVSQRLAFERADVITAAVSNGVPAKMLFNRSIGDSEGYAPEDFASEHAIPIAFYGGEFDHNWPMAHEAAEDIEGVNNWLALLGHEPDQSVDLSHNLRRFSDIPAEKNMGLLFARTDCIHADGIDYWIGEFLNNEGIPDIRFTEAAGAIHWPTHYMCENAFDFLEDFVKIPESGLTIYTGEMEDYSDMTYMSPDGWNIRYNANVVEGVEIDEHTAQFVYLGEAAGTSMLTVSYIPEKQPEEVLYDVTSPWGREEDIERIEGFFPGTDDKWGYWRILNPGEDGAGIAQTAIAGEYNGGVLMFEVTAHMCGDNSIDVPMNDTLAELIGGITYENFEPQTMYEHIPGTYILKTAEEDTEEADAAAEEDETEALAEDAAEEAEEETADTAAEEDAGAVTEEAVEEETADAAAEEDETEAVIEDAAEETEEKITDAAAEETETEAPAEDAAEETEEEITDAAAEEDETEAPAEDAAEEAEEETADAAAEEEDTAAVCSIILNEDHTGTITFEDTSFILWGSTELIAADGSFTYEYDIEGDSLYLNRDGLGGEWIAFEKTAEP